MLKLNWKTDCPQDDPKFHCLEKKKKGDGENLWTEEKIENGFYYEKIHESVKIFPIIV